MTHAAAAVLSAVLTYGAHSILDRPDAAPYQAVAAQIEADEGFRTIPYLDTRGHWTVGFGTNLDLGLTRPEAASLLRARLDANGRALEDAWQPFVEMPDRVQAALVEMSVPARPGRRARVSRRARGARARRLDLGPGRRP